MNRLITIAFLCFGFQSLVGQSNIRVKLHTMTGYEGHEDFAKLAIQKLEMVVNSEQFKQSILNGNFTKRNGYTNEQIYDLILKAHEIQGKGGQDSVIDLRIRTITLERDGKRWMRNCKIGSPAGTIGIDGQGDGETAICPQRLSFWKEQSNVASLAGHYAHEYMHILGFSHSGRRKSSSLVYQVGNIVERLVKELN